MGVFHGLLLTFDGGNSEPSAAERNGVVSRSGGFGYLNFLQNLGDLDAGGPFTLQSRGNS